MADQAMETFLMKVDDIGSLIQGMNKEDEAGRNEAMEKADKYLQEYRDNENGKGSSRTVINKYMDEKPNTKSEDTSADAFKAAVEQDARERSERRKTNLKKSTCYKESGNRLFKEEDYSGALEWYTKAITLSPDQVTYYSNRAQTYIKLEKFEKALGDCETGMKLDKSFAKLHVHKGKSLMFSRRFEEAIDAFQELINLDKRHKSLVSGYVKEVEKAKEDWCIREETNSLLAQGDIGLSQMKGLINKLRKGGQTCVADDINQITSLIKRESDRVAFKEFKGFNIFKENDTFKKMASATDTKLNTKVLELLSAVVSEDEANSCIVSSMDIPLDVLMQSLQKNSTVEEKTESIRLLDRLSQYEEARKNLMKKLRMKEVTDILLSLIGGSSELSLVAMRIVNNMALNKKYIEECEEKLSSDFIPGIIEMIERFYIPLDDEKLSETFLPLLNTSITTIANLFHSARMRELFKENKKIWSTPLSLVEKYASKERDSKQQRCILSILGMLMNLSVDGGLLPNETCHQFVKISSHLLSSKNMLVQERCTGIWNHVINGDDKLLEEAIKQNIPDRFIDILKGENSAAKKYLMKCMVLFTNSNQKVCEELYQRKALPSLVNILSSSEDVVIGNTALVISHLICNRKIMNELTNENIIKHLLKHATNGNLSKTVRHNCAVAIGKYASADQRCLQQLRDLHGLEILHEVMKENKLN